MNSNVLQFVRYIGAGVINTVVGYGIIFGAMMLGASPYSSDVAGYSIGLTCSYTLNKYFVFLSKDKPGTDTVKFLIAFAIAYSLNLGALHIALLLGVDKYIAQIIAAVFYTGSMYLLSRFWVYKSTADSESLGC